MPVMRNSEEPWTIKNPDCGSGGRWFESTQLYQLSLCFSALFTDRELTIIEFSIRKVPNRFHKRCAWVVKVRRTHVSLASGRNERHPADSAS